MTRIVPPIAIGTLILLALLMRGRGSRKHSKQAEDLKHATSQAIDAVDDRILELRERAKKLRGEARQRLQEQAHDLEGRQRELRARLDEVRTEALRLVHGSDH